MKKQITFDQLRRLVKESADSETSPNNEKLSDEALTIIGHFKYVLDRAEFAAGDPNVEGKTAIAIAKVLLDAGKQLAFIYDNAEDPSLVKNWRHADTFVQRAQSIIDKYIDQYGIWKGND